MAKLTLTQRDAITLKILSETFSHRGDAIRKREAALAAEVVLDRYGRDAFERFAAIPEGWLPMISRLNVGYGNHRRQLCFPESRALPAELYHGGMLTLNDRLGRKLVALDEEEAALMSEHRELSGEVSRALVGFTTEAQLREGWPEAHAHLSSDGPRVTALPAVRIEDLNRKIEKLKKAA